MLQSRFRALGALLMLVAATASDGGRPVHAQNKPGDLPPLSYVCPMPEDAEVLESAPGKCRKCGMVLKPVRLDLAYSCPRHPFVMVGTQGICPVDRQPLTRITASVYWTCAGAPDVHELAPGRCRDGQPRVQAFERLAHGDHNARHGGQFFMADDNWHHIEGTHPARNTFRVFLYDDYTRPIAPRGVSGRAIVLDGAGNEVSSIRLTRGRVGRTLEARVPPSAALRVKLMLRLRPNDHERVFDFAFTDITREPAAATTSAPPSTMRVAPQTAVPAAAAAVEPVMTSFLSQAPLPVSVEGLVEELTLASRALQATIERGEFGAAWLPAMRGKDVAIELEQRGSQRVARAALAQAVKQLVLAAFQIDAVGDLGDKDKINEAYGLFSASASAVVGAFTSR